MMPILSERFRVTSALGIMQIFAWGSTYYLLAVLSGPIQRDTGWSATSVTAGISVGLLASGLVAMRIGKLIQTFGGRPVLAASTGLIAAGLVILAASPNLPAFLIAWCVIGVGMGAGLYDAAFSTLGRIYGSDARRAITTLTLWGGFASTVCWPLSAFGVQMIGWRGTCLAYAALQITFLLPLCVVALPRQSKERPVAERATEKKSIRFDLRFWLIALAGTTLSFNATAWSVLLIAMLNAGGVSIADSVSLGMLIGPAQVAARVIEMALGGRHHPIWSMLVATGLVAFGFLGLTLQIPAAFGLIAYGAGNGIWSIARGALPLALFGPQEYPSIMGKLAKPNLLVAAAAPSIGAAALEKFGDHATLILLTSASLIPVVCALALMKLIRTGSSFA